MRTATALTLIAIGAIFAFAITAHPSFLNVQVVGWVLILTGIGGMIVPRRGRGWLRRSVIVKGSPDISNMDADELANAGSPLTGTIVTTDDDAIESTKIEEFVEK